MATDPKVVAERLTALYVADPDADVRADALTALAQVHPDEARESAALRGGALAIRQAAALLRLERSAPPYPAELIDVVAADGTEPDGGSLAFPGLGSHEHRLTSLLTADADADWPSPPAAWPRVIRAGTVRGWPSTWLKRGATTKNRSWQS